MERVLRFGQYALRLQPLKLMEGRRRLHQTPQQLKVLAHVAQAQGTTIGAEKNKGYTFNKLSVQEDL